jgi:hypothetical protein
LREVVLVCGETLEPLRLGELGPLLDERGFTLMELVLRLGQSLLERLDLIFERRERRVVLVDARPQLPEVGLELLDLARDDRALPHTCIVNGKAPFC